jgi:pimeloyl-ACP methyl ester carboxylesterase
MLIAASALAAVAPSRALLADDCVVLLHGLGRSAHSMRSLEAAIEEQQYRVVNVDYPSRKHPIDELSELALDAGLSACRSSPVETIHFVTHSLGGILVRYFFAHHELEELGRVVMLAPPNRGSEIVDRLGNVPGFGLLNGPAGAQLGTGPDAVPLTLGAVSFSVGVIAGTKTVDPVLSRFLPNPDDGKVSVERTKVEGMADFIEVKASHPFIMHDEEAIRQTIAFLSSGEFIHDSLSRSSSR